MTSSESKDSKTVVIEISGVDPIFVFGPEDKLLRTIEESFPDVRFTARGNEIEISGPSSSVALAEQRLRQIISAVSSGREVTPADLRRTEPDLLSQSILSSRGKSIRPKPLVKKSMSSQLIKTPLFLGLVLLEPERPTWLWQRQCRLCSARKFPELS